MFQTIRKSLSAKINGAVKALASAREVIIDNEGASEHTDKTVWIIIGIVLGALLLTALGVMFKDTLIPSIQSAISKMFNVTI